MTNDITETNSLKRGIDVFEGIVFNMERFKESGLAEIYRIVMKEERDALEKLKLLIALEQKISQEG